MLVNPSNGDESALDYDAVAQLPMVAEFSRLSGVAVLAVPPYQTFDDLFDVPSVFASDGEAIFNFDRPVLVEGRLPRLDASDEIYLGEAYAESAGYSVGDVLAVRSFQSEELDLAFELVDSGDGAGGLDLLNDPLVGQTIELRVAGIGNLLEDVAVDEGYEPFGGWIGPAVYADLGEPSAGYGGAVVRLNSPDDVDDFKAAVDALAPGEKVVYQSQAVTRAKALRATEPSATALAVFAVVTALLGALLTGQAISRRFQLDARDNETLSALGVTRDERCVASMLRLLAATLLGVAGGLLLATVLSELTPVGPAATAEPSPGINFDVPILLIGAPVVLAVVMALGAVPAWHNAGHHRDDAVERGSAIASWLAGHGASAPVTTGVRFGLEPGRGHTAVPTRATIIGALTAVAVATATIIFASSLDRVVSDGRFYGSNFDVAIDAGQSLDVNTEDQLLAAISDFVSSESAIVAASRMRIGELAVNGMSVTALAFSTPSEYGVELVVEPTIADGNAPVATGEIALGRTTMNDLGVSIGDSVNVVSPQFTGEAQVVGRAVLPGVGLYQGSDRTSIGVGAIVSDDMLGTIADGSKEFVVVDVRDGTDLAALQTRVDAALADVGTAFLQADGRPSDIVSLAELRSLPVALATALVVLVAFTVLHAMVVAVRRRRRDIAVLQALGSTSGELTAVGVWQGVTIGVAALAFGVPLGIVVGRWVWILLANGFGTLAEPVVPALGLVALAAGVLVLTATAGVVPIRRGLRFRPAEVLRSE